MAACAAATPFSAAEMSIRRFQLHLRVQGRTVLLNARGCDTVEALGRAVHLRTGLPPCCFTLYAGSKPLLQGALELHGLYAGSSVEVKLRGRGGAPPDDFDPAPQPPPAMEGWLRKRSSGRFGGRLQRRYFVLREDALHYFANDREANPPRRSIPLRCALARSPSSSPTRACSASRPSAAA